jgi:LysM repeat protein
VQYQVKKGDTVSSIARTLGAKLADVRAANGGDDQLAIGKTLSIAVSTTTPRPTRSTAKTSKTPAAKPTAKVPSPPAAPAPPTQSARRSSSS